MKEIWKDIPGYEGIYVVSSFGRIRNLVSGKYTGLTRIEYCKKYRENNKEYFKEYRKDYYQSNKERLKEQSKNYYENNKEYYKEYYSEYYKKHKK